MVTVFNGFSLGVLGKKLPADTTLNGMKKSELIELLHLAESNYDALMQFYTNAVNANKKIQRNIIYDFADRVEECLGADDRDIYCKAIVREVTDQMKGEAT